MARVDDDDLLGKVLWCEMGGPHFAENRLSSAGALCPGNSVRRVHSPRR